MKMALLKLALATSVGVVTLAACGSANDGYDPAIPTTMTYVSGSGQSGNAGDPVGELLTIKVTNFVGDPVAGVDVEWFVVTGQGTVSSANSVTDVNGLSQVSWILGPIIGQQSVQAVTSLSGSPIAFAATARVGDSGGGEEIRSGGNAQARTIR